MIAAISLLVILTISILVTRIATIALALTGMSHQTARFQARSAFTGVGFTTSEAERVMTHPVRRRILMLLMLLGNAGIVTAISSMLLTFVNTQSETNWLWRFVILLAGVSALWTAAHSRWIDRYLSAIIRRLLNRWTHIEARDYVGLLHLGGEYKVSELQLQEDDWLADRTLGELNLSNEGVIVLGVQTADGEYHGVPTRNTRLLPGDTVVVYGRDQAIAQLDQRQKDTRGELQRLTAVAQQKQIERESADVHEDDEGEEP